MGLEVCGGWTREVITRCLRERRFSQEKVVKQMRVGVSATYTYDLEIE